MSRQLLPFAAYVLVLMAGCSGQSSSAGFSEQLKRLAYQPATVRSFGDGSQSQNWYPSTPQEPTVSLVKRGDEWLMSTIDYGVFYCRVNKQPQTAAEAITESKRLFDQLPPEDKVPAPKNERLIQGALVECHVGRGG